MSLPQGVANVEPVPHAKTARRLTWAHLPPAVRGLVERRLGSPVVDAQSQDSGFTPGFASRLAGENGARLFVKAASKKAQRPFADAYAEEARRLKLLPSDLPVPRLLWSQDDELWVVLAFECIDGAPPGRPWRSSELDACLDTLDRVADRLNPTPAGFDLRPITADVPGLHTGWENVQNTQPDWPHLAEASELARRFPEFEGNHAFVHADARDDNFIIDQSGQAWLCDWNWPALGPVWLDAVDLLVTAHGDGLDAEALLASRAITKDVAPDHIDCWLAALCGYMLQNRDMPAPPTSPYLRVHANWWAEASWSWLTHRRGWT